MSTESMTPEWDAHRLATENAQLRKDALKLSDLSEREIARLRADNERLRAMLTNPTRHKFWGAGEPDCPRDIKAGNGELHTLRCKVCGIDSPREDFCRTALTPKD